MSRIILFLSLISFIVCDEGVAPPPPPPPTPTVVVEVHDGQLDTNGPAGSAGLPPGLPPGLEVLPTQVANSSKECSAVKFFPFGLPIMIADDQLRDDICVKKNKQMIDPLVCWHDCYSKIAAGMEGATSILSSCWTSWAGNELPKTPEDWLQWFCATNNSWIYKNMADHCLIHSITDDFTNKTIWKNFKTCPASGTYKFDETFDDSQAEGFVQGAKGLIKKIGKLFGADPDIPARKKDLFAPVMTMSEASMRIEMICKNNHEAMLKQQAVECDCLMRSHVDRKDDVETCWSLMVANLSYPKDNAGWKSFMCEQDDPFGVREGFEYCLMKKFKLTTHSECDQFNLFKTSYHIFRPELPPASVAQYQQIYREHETQMTQANKDKKIEELNKKREEIKERKLKGVVNPWCQLIQKDGKIITDSPSAKTFLEKNPLLCLYKEGGSEYMPVADLCIKFYAKLDNSTVSGPDFDIPKTEEQWLQFSCSLKDYDTSMKEMSLCIKQSVKRANNWIRATDIIKKFNPGKALTRGSKVKDPSKDEPKAEAAISVAKFLRSVQYCLR